MMSKIIICPDIHCRSFYKPVLSTKDVPIIFLGDYLCPYYGENTSTEGGIANLEEIIDLGTPVVSFIAWLLLTVVSAALLCALTGVIANAYLLHIYYLTSINNQLLANKKVEVEQKVETKIEEPVEDAE